MSRRELADAVNAAIWTAHGVREYLDENDIGKLERGVHRWPGARRREAFRRVLDSDSDAELGFYIVRGTSGADPEWADAAARVPGERSSAVADLEAMLATTRRLDHRVGSAAALPMVAAQRRLVSQLLQTQPSAHLLGLLSELRQLHGWLLFDVGEHAQAITELTAAHDAARDVGDHALQAYVLGPNLGLVEMYGGRPARGLDHASAAVTVAQRTGDPRLLSFTLAIAARCSARLGLAQSTRELLDDAADALGRDTHPADHPTWLGVFDQAALFGHTGSCLLDLGAPADAARVLGDQACSSSDMFARNRTLWALDRAAAHIAADEMDHACADVQDALTIGARVTSPRTSDRMLATATAVRRRQDTASTRALVATAYARCH